ncbi:MAG: CDP-glycerol--glycerophosphate glycerophosphotransferase, partial [Clostridia bacterium]|nr:CDP-glycerol--glycerophosphate glycerophosphotransferase [Clostridia bacterium]
MHFYIDPGTGSMLFTVLLGIIGAGIYSLRMAFIKLRYKFGGKVEQLGKKIPFVIFSDDKRYWNIFEPILKILSGYGKEILYITASEDDPALACTLPNFKAEYLPGNKIYTRLNFLEANVVFSTTPGLDVYQWKRSKGVDKYVHIPHAASEIILYRMFGIDYYDAIMLSGEYQAKNIRDLEALRNLPAKDLVMVGIPYMDEMVKRLQSHEKTNNEQKTVLLAPSWGSSALFAVYGGRIIEQLLKTDYHIIIRPHPQS